MAPCLLAISEHPLQFLQVRKYLFKEPLHTLLGLLPRLMCNLTCWTAHPGYPCYFISDLIMH